MEDFFESLNFPINTTVGKKLDKKEFLDKEIQRLQNLRKELK